MSIGVDRVGEIVAACSAASQLNRMHGKSLAVTNESSIGVQNVLNALEQFQECVRYLNTRRSTGAVLDLSTEANVQDVLYVMLRPWLVDLVPENPIERVSSRYAIQDLGIPSIRCVIEAKFIRDKEHGKSVSKELHDDIELYRRNPRCEHLVFFVYDPNSFIPDQARLRESLEVVRTYDGVPLLCYLVVKP